LLRKEDESEPFLSLEGQRKEGGEASVKKRENNVANGGDLESWNEGVKEG